ncbi:hypothetical protein [Rhizobium sp. NFR03]|uniref:hypothetical protein n=1 Tax=Rhizobium sp. NFR03 TaxID=1566263 RepID=UPI0008AEBD0B|nr:hypothetical protein [Rhizobium sp. NFR03]SER57110.1 hypothetical protein SAMN03159406_00515 [Rhizobium sp. NFR03]
MHQLLQNIANELDVVSQQISALSTEQRVFTESSAWHMPAIGYKQLADMPYDLGRSIRTANTEELDNEEIQQCEEILVSLAALRMQLLPNFGANLGPAINGYMATMSYISIALTPMLSWWGVENTKLPGQLVRKLSKLSREIDQMAPDKEALSSHIQVILDARQAADRLPTDLQELKATQAEIRAIATTSAESSGRIKNILDVSISHSDQLREMAIEAESLVKQASDAYGITTSISLATAFDVRAKELGKSVNTWSVILAATLIIMMIIASYRYFLMEQLFTGPVFDSARVWIQLLISIFSVAAPGWFAWLSTKQISQRFRLAEDYAFKASVATAYEGYRREAKRIDPTFEKALFASALSRLDEPPLRLMDTKTHGSPLHELSETSSAKLFIKSITDRLFRATTKD